MMNTWEFLRVGPGCLDRRVRRKLGSTQTRNQFEGGNAMSQVVGLSLSIAILGAIWAFLALGPLSGFVLVWAGFIAWGCFFHTGGDNKALTKTIVGTVYGAIVGWIALLSIVQRPES